jgi:Ca2+-binding EF-hand superfamily protein
MHRAIEHAECSICYEPFYEKPCAMLLNAEGRRTCPHYFHADCIAQWAETNRRCPMCNSSFTQPRLMVSPLENPAEWFRMIDVDGNGVLSASEITEALKLVLNLDYTRIEAESAALFRRWDSDGNHGIDLNEFIGGVLPYLRRHYPGAVPEEPPDIRANPRSWFEYWDEDHSGALAKEEVIRALIKTFHIHEVPELRALSDVVSAVWCIFDDDGSGEIDEEEFLRRDGLCETLVASLGFR